MVAVETPDVELPERGLTSRPEPMPLLPDPDPQDQRFHLISVDDHFLEPPTLFTDRLSEQRHGDLIPHFVDSVDEPHWLIEGEPTPLSVANVGGAVPEAVHGSYAIDYNQVRKGTWDVHERVRDMELGGIAASLNFPSLIWGFCGQRLMRMKDPQLARDCVLAYNDWTIDEWVAAYPDRLLPGQIPWLPDAEIAAEDVRRNAERGFTSVSFSENPAGLGFPSIHSGYWDVFLAACEETETTVNLHLLSSEHLTGTGSPGAPYAVPRSMFFLTSVETTNDWLWSGIPLRFPRIKIAIGEGGVGWLPALLDRIEYVTARDPVNEWDPSKSWRRAGITPGEALLRNFWFMGSWDPTGFRLLDRVGADNILVGTDYPHQDTTWPKCQDRIAGEVTGLSDEDVRKLTYANACDLYRFPLPSSN